MTGETILMYSLRCRNCRYSRHFGYARITAECKAVAHALPKGHIVDITVTDLATLTTITHLTVPRQTADQEGIPF